MKIAILTTETTHHAHFVREIVAHYPDVRVICETKALQPPFDTRHDFETQRDAFERKHWFSGKDAKIAEFAPTKMVESANAADGVAALADTGADIAVVFGTGKLSSALIGNGPRVFLNLHGGDPEEYRGLDADLDGGEISLQQSLALQPGMPLHQLRSVNTQACVRLFLAAVGAFSNNDDVPSRQQRARGRYYSFMPAVLKELCVGRFAKHTGGLGKRAPQ
jgi:methionyl-tRNA formyltransferase